MALLVCSPNSRAMLRRLGLLLAGGRGAGLQGSVARVHVAPLGSRRTGCNNGLKGRTLVRHGVGGCLLEMLATDVAVMRRQGWVDGESFVMLRCRCLSDVSCPPQQDVRPCLLPANRRTSDSQQTTARASRGHHGGIMGNHRGITGI